MLRRTAFLCFWFLLGGPAEAAEIPVDVGVGPAYYLIPEKLQDQPQTFYGLHIEANAVLDHRTIERNKGAIPARYRNAANGVEEARVGYLLVPDAIMAAPRHQPGGFELFGASWRPLALGIPVVMGPLRVALDAGLLLTYAFINVNDKTTHFLRPGADARLEAELKLSEQVLVSVGGSAAYYIPETVGDQKIFRIESAFLVFHYRFMEHVSL